MTAESNKDTPTPESQLDDYAIAQRRLTDLGLTKDKDKGGEHMHRYINAPTVMLNAVKVVSTHLGRTPEQFQASMQIKLYRLYKDMDSFDDMWRPTIREEIDKALLNQEQ
jgi:hypothetical protein